MRVTSVAASLAIALAASVASDDAGAKLNKREFCAATEYCRIPVRFRSGPFLAKPLVRVVPLRDIQRRCSASGHAAVPFGASNPVIGCAMLRGGRCVVYLPAEVRAISEEMFAMVLEHELAHCRGWVHGR